MNGILTPVFYKGIIYVLTIAVFMLIFEVIFFKVIILPENDKFIHSNLEKLNNLVKDNKFDTNMDIASKIIANNRKEKDLEDVLSVKYALSNTINERELDLIKNINNDLIIFMSVIIVIFAFLIYMCYTKIETVPKDVMPIASIALLTIVILIIFQSTMYVYGHKFLYTTDIELKDNIMNYISISTYAK
jgi:hypothetical protein